MSRRASDGDRLLVLPSRALRELAEHYDILADAVLVEADGRWAYANPAALAMFGCTEATQLVGRSTLEVVPPEDRDVVLARRRRAEEGRVNLGVRQRLIRMDGSIFLAEISSQTISLAHGSRNVLVVARDVTQRVEQEAQFTATFENAAVGMAHLSLEGRFIRVNRHLAALLGYDRRELKTRTVDDVTYAEDRLADRRTFAAMSAGEIDHYSLEKRCVGRDGSVFWVQVSRSLIRKVDGSPDYIVCVAEDIDERKKAQEALKASEERFRHLVEFGSELIVVVDPAGVIRYIAGTVNALLGFDPQEVAGRSAFDFIHPDDRDASRARIQRLVAHPRSSEQAVIRLRTRTDEWRTFQISNVNMLDVPSVRGLVINGRDVTEQLRLGDELGQLRRVESLGRVAAAVAHEFNNVLAGADAFATVLARKNDPALEPIVRGLKAAISRGRQTTAPILQYGQPAVLARTEIDVRSWLQEVKTETEPLLGSRNSLSVEVAGDATFRGDRRQLTQVLTNLILNARDASAVGEPIVVSARPAASGVVLEVRDRGRGIPPELRDRIFDPLFTTKPNGTGLGLAVVQQIVVRHGGTVTVDSEPGKGSTFAVTLP